MKEDKSLSERCHLIERELITLTEKVDKICNSLTEIEDLKLEIRGLKLFLGREYPELKSELPEIVRKVSRKG